MNIIGRGGGGGGDADIDELRFEIKNLNGRFPFRHRNESSSMGWRRGEVPRTLPPPPTRRLPPHSPLKIDERSYIPVPRRRTVVVYAVRSGCARTPLTRLSDVTFKCENTTQVKTRVFIVPRPVPHRTHNAELQSSGRDLFTNNLRLQRTRFTIGVSVPSVLHFQILCTSASVRRTVTVGTTPSIHNGRFHRGKSLKYYIVMGRVHGQ